MIPEARVTKEDVVQAVTMGDTLDHNCFFVRRVIVREICAYDTWYNLASDSMGSLINGA
jgi:hypothetical protein